jgi:hypothetical protein
MSLAITAKGVGAELNAHCDWITLQPLRVPGPRDLIAIHWGGCGRIVAALNAVWQGGAADLVRGVGAASSALADEAVRLTEESERFSAMEAECDGFLREIKM